jgi:hypothetical protein
VPGRSLWTLVVAIAPLAVVAFAAHRFGPASILPCGSAGRLSILDDGHHRGFLDSIRWRRDGPPRGVNRRSIPGVIKGP